MKLTSSRATLAVAAALIATAAHADFQAALKEYNAGHYDVAHAQFLALAELGDCSSQFNLAAMALQGQGGPKDSGSGVGWLQAAAGNGCEQLVGHKVAALQAQLSTDEQHAAADIVARYGRDALQAQGVISPDFSCRGLTAASVQSSPTPEYPRLAGPAPERAIVISELTIGRDGRGRDPEILLAVPAAGFAAAAVESWLNTSFTPAMRGGSPVESRLQAKLVFTRAAGALADTDTYKGVRQRADAGDADAQYVLGLTATLDSSLGISYTRAGQLLLGSARDGDVRAQYWVGSQLHASSSCHPQASGAIWLQHAAAGGDAAAQLTLARDLLGANPSGAQLAEARALLERAAGSDSYYVRKHVAALLAAAPQDAVRDPATALALAGKLAGGEIQSDPQMFEAVGAAYAASGDFSNAARQQQVAIKKARTLGWDTRAMAQRLASYQHDQPWRGDLFAPPAG